MLGYTSTALPLLTTAGLPEWVWATLLVALFFGLSIATVIATRFPTQQEPPPFDPPAPAERAPRAEE
jgi:hypothetical protein